MTGVQTCALPISFCQIIFQNKCTGDILYFPVNFAKENTAVSLNFFVSEKDTLHLFERNVELLQDAINAQGYACTSELSLKEKEVDIVNDFLATNKAPIGDMKRYNFDLRA